MDVAAEHRTQHNDTEGLRRRLSDIFDGVNWLERIDVTLSYCLAQDLLHATKEVAVDKTFSDDNVARIHDDFQREASLQAQKAVIEALPKLHSENVITKRPADYFAEMVKSDIHMQKIRRKLLEKQENIKSFEKAKRIQFIKKFGKKVEKEVISNRKNLQSGKSNGKLNKGANLVEMKTQKSVDNYVNKSRSPRLSNKGRKDMKYGYGRKKKNIKKNTSASANTSFFDSGIHGKPRKKRSSAGNKRPGKRRRLQKR
ncbi:uncharacterized protein TRIADDRAFT_57829 [Trichoplax adhaerens]|uniref:rRNA-processing protein EBP2 n=1 Tax=Trichoplax adhaerens TaxID=10228 RepID=B3S1N8_TRIAD|nr:hypothetical protein TRIADDRAFT_57829 [Trichoplax adhaerens]EDV23324.1 hypothetical protein TRIADDRAFT_57829 [Trichoplax adhaerens]|eukprot:XP_002114234.1 hypothetical protein TRIADDRAFT_57829 [Trichoplax adhaerens]